MGKSTTHLNDKDITWDDVSCHDFLFLTISDYFCLECDICLELGDDITGLLFLVPTDEGVL